MGFERFHLVFALVFLCSNIRQVHARDLPISLPDVLVANGLPTGLLPSSTLEEFTIAANGTFRVKLQDYCFADMEDSFFFHRYINGTVSKGRVSDLYGVSVKRTFSWSPVSAIEIDPSNGNHVVFHLGMFKHTFPVSKFQGKLPCETSPYGYRAQPKENNYTGIYFEDDYYGAPRRALG